MRLKALKIQSSTQGLPAASDARMGETLQPVTTGFNRAVRVESRAIG
ncbi:MAG: hypothetical protein HWE30_16485 [Methylocystaceae bacterium]|nr:hypothetical protein [Methylocystaceae bacterium]